MAVLKSNPLLKWVLAPLLMLVVVVGFSVLKGKPAQNPQAQSPELTAEQAKALGVDGDTNNDTIRTLTAETKSLREDLKRAIGDNDRNREENAQLKDNLKNINQNVDQRLQAGITQMQEKNDAQTKGLFDSVQQQLNSLSKLGDQKSGGSNDMPVGLGIGPGDGQQFKSSSSAADLVWIDPQDARPVDATGKPIAAGSSQAASGFAFPTAFGTAGQKALDAAADGADRANASLDTKPQDRKKVRKVYTLPQNSTLMGSISMTALIGRVPVDGTVNDPYPFKVLIGPDNLTANGIDLPDVAGAVASGTASGDWTLSCVRGQIRSLTFVFNDGRVRTLPMPQENGQNNNASNNQNGSSNGQPAPIQGGMGWISDPYGIPCISGERRSNAAQYLGSQALITAAGAGAASLIKSDGTSSSYVSTSNGTIGTTGISGNEAMGKILGQGVSDISTWVNKLYGQAFAAIYVQPGAKVAIHLDQELAIDYELKGRKVDYRTGGSHAANNLD